jgi:L-amino acid N-acyltransferase YncA
MDVQIRAYTERDIPAMAQIWNEVVEEGIAFPQEEILTISEATRFFKEQTYSAVAACANTDEICGLYILHPNNVGRCGHISNASYAVRADMRGRHIGEKLVCDCLKQASLHGFGVLQFNAVVSTNIHARHLYERLGFVQLGTIPKGFRMKDGHYEDICPYYHAL